MSFEKSAIKSSLGLKLRFVELTAEVHSGMNYELTTIVSNDTRISENNKTPTSL